MKARREPGFCVLGIRSDYSKFTISQDKTLSVAVEYPRFIKHKS